MTTPGSLFCVLVRFAIEYSENTVPGLHFDVLARLNAHWERNFDDCGVLILVLILDHLSDRAFLRIYRFSFEK